MNEIEAAIKARAGITISLSEIAWNLNPDLSKNVIDVMNKYNYNYSMTTYNTPIYGVDFKTIIVNRKVNNKWFVYIWTEMPY
ncbi:MAG: hypothetical protein FWF22_01520 [Treponema sp.]|nr:hypothetical protein [Treponema sp.]